jgi:hypothetical protein
MEDVTHLFNNYRECVRHLGNEYFRSLPDSCRDWDLHDEYDDTAVGIFSSLVLRPLGIFDHKLAAGYLATPQPLPGFYVIPNIPHGTPIMINREQARSGYWDHPIRTVTPNDVELYLLRFFDFDRQNYREYRYFEALVHSSACHPEIAGRLALLEVEHAKVLFKRPDEP